MAIHEDKVQIRNRESRVMQRARPLRRPALVAALVVTLLIGVLGGSIVGYLVRGPTTTEALPSTEYLFLTIGFDFATGLDKYMPANFTVPTHTLIIVTITNYDNASNPVSAPANAVAGTVGDVMTIQASSQVAGMVMGTVPATQVSHTFTMSGGPYTINVPIPAANSLADPVRVTFRAYFNVTGTFDWRCQAPCDTLSMNTPGFMRGTVTVVDG